MYELLTMKKRAAGHEKKIPLTYFHYLIDKYIYTYIFLIFPSHPGHMAPIKYFGSA